MATSQDSAAAHQRRAAEAVVVVVKVAGARGLARPKLLAKTLVGQVGRVDKNRVDKKVGREADPQGMAEGCWLWFQAARPSIPAIPLWRALRNICSDSFFCSFLPKKNNPQDGTLSATHRELAASFAATLRARRRVNP